MEAGFLKNSYFIPTVQPNNKTIFVKFPNNKFQVLETKDKKTVQDLIKWLEIIGDNFILTLNEKPLDPSMPIEKCPLEKGTEINLVPERISVS